MLVTLGKKYLLDTNILIYSLDRTSSYFKKSSEIISLCFEKKIIGFIAQQNLLELANILLNTYKIPKNQVIEDISLFSLQLNLKLISPTPKTAFTFLKLLGKSGRKKEVFDLYLAATMIDSGLTNIITRNEKDFTGIKKLKVVNPFTVKKNKIRIISARGQNKKERIKYEKS